jgi:hypothetical protein
MPVSLFEQLGNMCRGSSGFYVCGSLGGKKAFFVRLRNVKSAFTLIALNENLFARNDFLPQCFTRWHFRTNATNIYFAFALFFLSLDTVIHSRFNQTEKRFLTFAFGRD